jgi:hypothetical protein
MDLAFSAEDQNFREEVRAFLRAAVPPELAERTRRNVHIPKDDLQLWNRILHRKGWSAPHWPKEYGGTGWSPAQILIFEEECAAHDAPFLSYFGLRLIGPLIYTFGTPQHKEAYLPGILAGETFWCQGFSEPSSGSDLASVRTTAVREGDHYVINGQKLWTTEAHFADKMFCLARTDAGRRPQKGGLSILFLDMDQPGVTVRPIITIDGGHSVNEVFLENVRVPATEVLGELGQGWDQAKFLLAHERVTNAHVPRSKRELALLKQMLRGQRERGLAPEAERRLRERIARIEIDLAALEWSVLRELFDGSGRRTPVTAAGLKLLGSELQQRLSETAIDLVGASGLAQVSEHAPADDLPADAPAWLPGLAGRQLFLRATTIYAGTTEIQREIVARHVFAGAR